MQRAVKNPLTKKQCCMHRNIADERRISSPNQMQAVRPLPRLCRDIPLPPKENASRTPTSPPIPNNVNTWLRESYPSDVRSNIDNVSELENLPDTFSRRPTIRMRGWDFTTNSRNFDAEHFPSQHSNYTEHSSSSLHLSHLEDNVRRLEGQKHTASQLKGQSEQPTENKATSLQNFKQRPSHNLKISGAYRVARDIYKSGPPGEGQELWESYVRLRQLRKIGRGKAKASETQTQSDVAAHALQKSIGLNNETFAEPTRSVPFGSSSQLSRGRQKAAAPLMSKAYSGETTTKASLGMPLSSHNVRTGATHAMDTNKPLPAIPKLGRPRSPDKGSGIVSSAASGAVYPAQLTRESPLNEASQHKFKQKPKTSTSTPWWKLLADRDRLKEHERLKRQISRPIAQKPNQAMWETVHREPQGSLQVGTQLVRPDISKPLPRTPDGPTYREKGKQKADSEISGELDEWRESCFYFAYEDVLKEYRA